MRNAAAMKAEGSLRPPVGGRVAEGDVGDQTAKSPVKVKVALPVLEREGRISMISSPANRSPKACCSEMLVEQHVFHEDSQTAIVEVDRVMKGDDAAVGKMVGETVEIC